jgi:small conductance mechanosensitive channel
MEEVWLKMQPWVALYGPRVLAALAILIIGRWVAKGIRGFLRRFMTRREADPMIISFTTSLTYVALLTFIVIAFLSQLGVQTTSFVAIIGAAGLAIALSLQGSLSNFAAGFLMLVFRPFTVGDYIEGAGTAGIVEETGIFKTQLKTPDNKVIFIPNSKLMDDNIVNYSMKDTRRVDMTFGVGYGDDLQKVRQVLQEIVDQDTRVLKDPAPAILVNELADSSVNFAVRVWVKTPEYWNVYFDAMENVKKRFDAEGISIPFPQRDVHLYPQA